MTDNHKKDIDDFSGVETTGHEWDGIKELNNPAPRWWLWVFFLCCIWSFGYWVVYPTWPTLFGGGERGGTKGAYEWTQYKQLEQQQQEIISRRSEYLAEFQKSSFEEIMKNPKLYAFAMAGGKSAFKDNCATCHGTGGSGGKGYPNLNDDDWLWGGTVEDIHTTLLYGIRSTHEDTRFSQMPDFVQMLQNKEIDHIAEYVFKTSHGQKGSEEGAALFQENCASCHGDDGRGIQEMGAPNLMDQIWLYSGQSPDEIKAQMRKPKHGMMPHWEGRLDPDIIRMLSIYVHELGGGE